MSRHDERIEQRIRPAGLDPRADMTRMMLLGATEAVREDEERGQRELLESRDLPTDVRPDDGRALLEEWGVRLAEPRKDDPLFSPATIPEGWRLVPVPGGRYWTDLVDQLGRRRASAFYKNTSYDRGAHLVVNDRFLAEARFINRDAVATYYKPLILDGGEVIWSGPIAVLRGSGDAYFDELDQTREACSDVLLAVFPWAFDRVEAWRKADGVSIAETRQALSRMRKA